MRFLAILRRLLKLVIFWPILLTIGGVILCINLFKLNYPVHPNWSNVFLQIRFYVIMLLACVIQGWFIFRYVKKKISKEQIKWLSVYSSSIVSVFALVAFISWIKIEFPLVTFIIISFLLLLLGIFHIWFTDQNKMKLNLSGFHYLTILAFNLLLGSIYFTAIIMLRAANKAIAIWDKIAVVNNWIFGSVFDGALLPFLLPFLFMACLKFWKQIPKLTPQAWEYNKEDIPPPLSIKPSDPRINCTFNVANNDIRIVTLPHYKVGDMFHRIIEGARLRGVKIPVSERGPDERDIPLKWYFVCRGVGTKKMKYVDPFDTFSSDNNKIKDGDIIYARNDP